MASVAGEASLKMPMNMLEMRKLLPMMFGEVEKA